MSQETVTPSEPPAVDDLTASTCPNCGEQVPPDPKAASCPGCRSPWRTRSFQPILEEFAPRAQQAAGEGREVIGFAMTRAERAMASRWFSDFESVSLYGEYNRTDHTSGVDARDLSRYSDNTFAFYFSILLYDYFPEHEAALREAYRVLRPGGVFATEIGPYRLRPGKSPPRTVALIEPRADYFSYVPKESPLSDIRVGTEWFVQAMRRVGFEAHYREFKDPSGPETAPWFVGVKPLKPPSALQRLKARIGL